MLFRSRGGRLLCRDRGRGGGTAGAHRQKEIPSGKFGFLLGHVVLLMNGRSYQKLRDVNLQFPLIQERSSGLLGGVLTQAARDENDSQWTLLDHLEGGLLDLEKRARELRDEEVKIRFPGSSYGVAKPDRRAVNEALEKTLLIFR